MSQGLSGELAEIVSRSGGVQEEGAEDSQSSSLATLPMTPLSPRDSASSVSSPQAPSAQTQPQDTAPDLDVA